MTLLIYITMPRVPYIMFHETFLFYHKKPGPLGQVTVQWFYHLSNICYSKAELLHNLTKK